ncbi:MAG: RNA methyltransferase [Ignavibacteria bacterium]|nr:RNA methyltransferase [Ignavibacteria bacterium]
MEKLTHSEILDLRITPETAKRCIRNPIYLLALNIRSLYNVGSLFRTADSALVEELILTGFTPHPPRDEIKKTALGADETVPWQYFKEPMDAITYLKGKSVKVIAVEITDQKRMYDSLTIEEFPLCLVLGNEITGIDNHILAMCDDAVEIPMYGVKHSLNVSVAAGITVFEAVRKFRNSV